MKRARIAAVAAGVALALLPTSSRANEWAWPLRGEVITNYSNDNAKPYAGGMHRGIDIAAEPGTKVAAARAGTVTYAGNLGSSGMTVALRSADGVHVSSYLHLSAIDVKRGELVVAGGTLGASGTSGERSTQQPHLHFGIRLADRDNFYIDPLSLLPPLGAPAGGPAAPVPATAPARANEAPAPAATRAKAPAPSRSLRPVPNATPRSLPAPGSAPLARPGQVAVPEPAPPLAAGVRSKAGSRRPVSAAPRRKRQRVEPVRHPEVSRGEPASGQQGSGLPFGRIALGGGVLMLGLALLAAKPTRTSRRAATTPAGRVAQGRGVERAPGPAVLGPLG